MRFLPVFSPIFLADPTKSKEEKRICLPAFKAPLAAIFKTYKTLDGDIICPIHELPFKKGTHI